MAASWIRHVTDLSYRTKEIPMWGNPPPFLWEDFSVAFGDRLELKDLKVQFSHAEWKDRDHLLSGLGNSPLQVCFDVSPLEGNVFWIMPLEDMTKCTAWALSDVNEGFSDPELRKGFYRYLILEALDVFYEVKCLGDLSLKLAEGLLPEEECYAIDISIAYGNQTVWGRVLCTPSFQNAFKQHFVLKDDLRSPVTSHIDLSLAITAGRTSLEQEDFKNAKEGDFILLDHFTYFPNTKKGTFTLDLENIPLFQLKLKDGKIKLLDFAYYYEESSMDQKKEMEEKLLPEEEIVPVEEEPSSHVSSFKEVPLKIIVEIARIKMPLEKLLQLKPGNILELSVKPEQGVQLTLEGKTVARGELLQIGETVGVKITEIHA